MEAGEPGAQPRPAPKGVRFVRYHQTQSVAGPVAPRKLHLLYGANPALSPHPNPLGLQRKIGFSVSPTIGIEAHHGKDSQPAARGALSALVELLVCVEEDGNSDQRRRANPPN